MNEKECSHAGCTHEKFEKNEKTGKCIFHCEKTDWYEEKNGEKIWKEDLVKKFWEEIREKKMAKEDYDFSWFVFPKFEMGKTEKSRTKIFQIRKTEIGKGVYKTLESLNFWEKENEIIFKKDVTFNSANFLEKANFHSVHFLKKANFFNTVFSKKIIFENTVFEGNVNFESTKFLEITDFSHAIFLKEAFFWDAKFLKWTNLGYIIFVGEAVFTNAKFSEWIEFSHAKFLENTLFNNTSFLAEVLFKSVEFEETTDFSFVKFLDEIDFEKTKFKGFARFGESIFHKKADFDNAEFQKVNFINARFLEVVFFYHTKFHDLADFSRVKFSEEKQALFEANSEEENKKTPKMIFHNVIFPSPVVFRNWDLSESKFLDARIDEVHFENCHFSPQKENEVIEKEELFDEREVLLQKDAKPEDFEKVERLYRQLKKNFDEKNDYQTADDFYVGEMEMMRRKLIADQKIGFWISLLLSSFLLYVLIGIMLFYFDNNLHSVFSSLYEEHGNAIIIPGLIIYIIVFSIIVLPVSLLFTKFITHRKHHAEKILWIYIYKLISNYNSSPLKAFFYLLGIIIFFGFLYTLLLIDKEKFPEVKFLHFLHYSISNTIPFVEAPEISIPVSPEKNITSGKLSVRPFPEISFSLSKENTSETKKIEKLKINDLILLFFVYLQKIISSGILLLFGLSLHRKFKR